MKKKKRIPLRHILPPLCVKLSLLIIISSLLLLITLWNYFLTYREIELNNFEVCESRCITIEKVKNSENTGKSHGRRIYSITLENGVVVAVYKDTIDDALSIDQTELLDLLTKQTLTYTYVPKRIFSNGAFVLVSISKDGEEVLTKSAVFEVYRQRLKPVVTITVILCSIGVLISIIPLIFNPINILVKRIKRKKKKQRECEKKEQQAKRREQREHEKQGQKSKRGKK